MKWQKLFRLFFFEHFFCVGCQTDWRSSFERAPEDTRVACRNRAGAAAVFCQHGGAVQRFHQQPPGRWLLHSLHGVWHRWWRYGSLYLPHFFYSAALIAQNWSVQKAFETVKCFWWIEKKFATVMYFWWPVWKRNTWKPEHPFFVISHSFLSIFCVSCTSLCLGWVFFSLGWVFSVFQLWPERLMSFRSPFGKSVHVDVPVCTPDQDIWAATLA